MELDFADPFDRFPVATKNKRSQTRSPCTVFLGGGHANHGFQIVVASPNFLSCSPLGIKREPFGPAAIPDEGHDRAAS